MLTMASQDDAALVNPNDACDIEQSNDSITVQITPTEENNPSVSEIFSLADSGSKLQHETLSNSSLSKDSVTFENVQSIPQCTSITSSSISSFSINTQSTGLKTLQSSIDHGITECSNAASFSTMGPPIISDTLLGSSSSPSAMTSIPSSSSKMSTLSAPMQVVSSVRTANQPKSSLTLQTNSLSTASATGNPRNKVALRRGRGLMDWVRLGHTCPDLAGTGGHLLQVTPKQLAKHNTRKDAWMALKGKVYNVTPYFEYHPGGEDELIKGVGIDATDIFNEVHKWVNYEAMLSKCLVGQLVEDSPTSCSAALRKPQKALLPLLSTFTRFLEGETVRGVW